MFSSEKFVHGITESLDQTIAQPTAWLIETLTSKAAQRKYAIALEVGQRLAEILRLVILATIATIDEYVEQCEAPATEPVAEVRQIEVSPQPCAARSMPKSPVRRIGKGEVKEWLQSIADEPMELEKMSVAELREECNRRGVRWNRANGGKHLSKALMIAALK